ncbi:MAG: rod-binding protein [Spirochaetaceae bacterium]|jgi:flagellar protein FlgJ|nr:rod-binding protein [Spirochaetaceae bacterium]
MKLESISALYIDTDRFTPAPALEKTVKAGTTFSALLEKESSESGTTEKPVIDKTDKLYEQCEALETFLIKNLLNSMRSTIQKTGLIDEGFAGKMYEDMLYDEYAKDFSKNADFGLAELAYLELTQQRGKK